MKEIVPVSAIIPCYCCLETIERAVQSVVDQTARPAELWLVDDASPDGGATLAKLHELQRRFAGILPIEVIALERNSGPATARNAAWERASQPYVAFLDADDSWHPEKLRFQYAWMEAHPEVMLTGHICANPGMPEIAGFPETCAVRPIGKRYVLLRNPFSTPSAMLRSDIPCRFRAEQSYAEDFFLWQQIVCSGYPVVRLELPLAYLHKAPYGEAGLSSCMWKMEKAELNNYRRLRQRGDIRALQVVALSAFSLAKYLRRLLLCRYGNGQRSGKDDATAGMDRKGHPGAAGDRDSHRPA